MYVRLTLRVKELSSREGSIELRTRILRVDGLAPYVSFLVCLRTPEFELRPEILYSVHYALT